MDTRFLALTESLAQMMRAWLFRLQVMLGFVGLNVLGKRISGGRHIGILVA